MQDSPTPAASPAGARSPAVPPAGPTVHRWSRRPALPARRGVDRADRDQRDSRDTGFALLEALFVIPLVFTIILSAMQLGEWWYARQLAQSTAQEAARTARAYNGTDAAGTTAGTDYLTGIDGRGGRILLDPTVTVRRTANLVTVHVHGHVPAVLPFLPSTVDEQSSGVPETFVPAG